MKKLFLCFLCISAVLFPRSAGAEPSRLHHDIQIRVTPDTHQLQVEDKITLPDSGPTTAAGKIHFLLHRNLIPESVTPGVRVIRESDRPRPEFFGGKDPSFLKSVEVPLSHYSFTLPPRTRTLTLKYRGKIHHPIRKRGKEYGRGFSRTAGTISKKGIFLSGSGFWYPWFGENLISFRLDVRLPENWHAVSQGRRVRNTSQNSQVQVRWDSSAPQEEIYLIGGRFTEYRRKTGAIQSMVFLQKPDPGLANKYLDATRKYLEMYSRLLGTYPYKKFALVENFWETGYGMPSFTLLGPRVIRLPFIIRSSYPHEILHDWWGNGVFVDYQEGNWSEGLTAYLSDHLMREQVGTATGYRRATLQKYADYVSAGKDFPLTEFRSRHNPTTEAVGYGKTLMFFHMLRRRMGDTVFTSALRNFYQKNKFRRAAFSDLRKAFEEAAGLDFRKDFRQWVHRTGAPELRVKDASAEQKGGDYLLTARLEQVQPGASYSLHVPIAVHLEGRKKAYQTKVVMKGRQVEIKLRLPARPVRLEVDPEFDLFRRVHRNEIPPALSKAFGARKPLILLPSAAPQNLRRAYLRLAESWKGPKGGGPEVRWDKEVNLLPNDRSVWLFGWENRHREGFAASLTNYEVSIRRDSVQIGHLKARRKDQGVVITARNPRNPDHAVAWVSVENVNAIAGLGRKLPHYGKYSYLVFEGDEPNNVAKGQWPVRHSPLSDRVKQKDSRQAEDVRGSYARRRALAHLPEDFTKKRMVDVVRMLSDDKVRGRGFGSAGLNQAADYIADRFRGAGLRPGGDREGSFFQTWRARGGEPPRDAVLKNVVGILPGSKPEWAGQSVVVGAHYDHLGLGWPDAHKKDRGKIHPGADDNASGIAVLLELAEVLAKSWKPERTVVFVAFSGEEAGRLGSKHYVKKAKRFPSSKAIAMLNLDTVGRLEGRKLMILGAGTAREWNHIFRGVGYVTGVPIQTVGRDIGSSDQKSFIDSGVPAVQVFSGPHLDYHRSTDTPDKIDGDGLVKVAKVMKETIEYLAGREEPLHSQIGSEEKSASRGSNQSRSGRKVRLGTIPDFGYDGRGVRISGVAPGSPAEGAGLREGDVILRLGETVIPDLRAFSKALKKLRPGDSVDIVVLRDSVRKTMRAKLAER